MNRYKEIAKLLLEIVAIAGGLQQLKAYTVTDNRLYWLFLGCWLFYLAYGLYDKLRYLLLPTYRVQVEIRLRHLDERLFLWLNRGAGVLAALAIAFLLFLEQQSFSGTEWVFVVSVACWVLYAWLEVPSIWLKVKKGHLNSSQLKERLPLEEVRQIVLSGNRLELLMDDRRRQQLRYIAWTKQEKEEVYRYLSQFVREPGQCIISH